MVIRSLPEGATRRVPVRVRHPFALTAGVVVAIAAIAGIVALIVASTHRGVGAPAGLARPAHETVIRLSQTAAVQYNPFGTSPEEPATVEQAIDGDVATTWRTSTYDGGVLGK